jgi:uncharacterized protein YaeQ
MALKATVFKAQVQISDMDRHYSVALTPDVRKAYAD